MTLVYLGLGSNMGDRADFIFRAIELLAAHPQIKLLAASSLYETEPVGNLPSGSPWFLNAAVAIETDLLPGALLDTCLDIEHALGRARTDTESSDPEASVASRTLDIDIVFFGDLKLNTPRLTIPHPQAHKRAFVLVPLLELAPEFHHPVLGQTIETLHLALEAPEDVQLYGVQPESVR